MKGSSPLQLVCFVPTYDPYGVYFNDVAETHPGTRRRMRALRNGTFANFRVLWFCLLCGRGHDTTLNPFINAQKHALRGRTQTFWCMRGIAVPSGNSDDSMTSPSEAVVDLNIEAATGSAFLHTIKMRDPFQNEQGSRAAGPSPGLAGWPQLLRQ